MPVEAEYGQTLVLVCNRNLGCIKGQVVYVVRRNGVVVAFLSFTLASFMRTYIRDPRYVRDRGHRGESLPQSSDAPPTHPIPF